MEPDSKKNSYRLSVFSLWFCFVWVYLSPLLLWLFLFLFLCIILTVTSHSPPAVKRPDNETIYRVSKQLCWGCVGESLQFLYTHNMVRAYKWELPLMWDSDLENYARWWAGQRKSDCKAQHSFPEYGFKLGENIYWGSGSTWTPVDAVNAWADEEKYYTYSTNTCQAGQICGHYTQIVWRNTRRIGCARVVCDSGDVFMTCNYDPVGNYVGQRPYWRCTLLLKLVSEAMCVTLLGLVYIRIRLLYWCLCLWHVWPLDRS